jgi:hypothetical protein
MSNIVASITIIGIFVGLMIMIVAFVKMFNIHKRLKKMKDEKFVPEDIRSKLLRYAVLSLVGTIVTFVSGFIGLFLR